MEEHQVPAQDPMGNTNEIERPPAVAPTESPSDPPVARPLPGRPPMPNDSGAPMPGYAPNTTPNENNNPPNSTTPNSGTGNGNAMFPRYSPGRRSLPMAPPVANEAIRPLGPTPNSAPRLPLPPAPTDPQSGNTPATTVQNVAASRTAASDDQLARAIAGQLKQLRQEGRLRDFRIDLRVHNGIAELRGHVQDQKQLALAIRAASRTRGIQTVHNRLTVQAEQRPTPAKSATATQSPTPTASTTRQNAGQEATRKRPTVTKRPAKRPTVATTKPRPIQEALDIVRSEPIRRTSPPTSTPMPRPSERVAATPLPRKTKPIETVKQQKTSKKTPRRSARAALIERPEVKVISTTVRPIRHRKAQPASPKVAPIERPAKADLRQPKRATETPRKHSPAAPMPESLQGLREPAKRPHPSQWSAKRIRAIPVGLRTAKKLPAPLPAALDEDGPTVRAEPIK